MDHISDSLTVNDLTIQIIEKGEEWGKTLDDEEKQPSEYSYAPYCKPDEDYAIFSVEYNTLENLRKLSRIPDSINIRDRYGEVHLLKIKLADPEPSEKTFNLTISNYQFWSLQWLQNFDPTCNEDKNYKYYGEEDPPDTTCQRSEDSELSKNIDLLICTFKNDENNGLENGEEGGGGKIKQDLDSIEGMRDYLYQERLIGNGKEEDEEKTSDLHRRSNTKQG